MVTQGTVRNVVDHQYGSELDGDHAAGATSLTVIWTNDFNADGGQLYFEDADGNVGEIVSYTIPTEDPTDPNNDTPSETRINLATPLANSYVSGDKVWVYPKKVERWAYFMEPNGSEPLPARVPHNLKAMFPLGARTDDTAEQIEVEGRGADQVVVDVLAEPVASFELPQGGSGPALERGLVWWRDPGTRTRVASAQGTEAPVGVDALLLASRPRSSDRDTIIQIGAEASGGSTQASVSVLSVSDGTSRVDVATGAVGKKLLDSAGLSDFEFATSGGWQPWTPTLTGWSANPTNSIYRYKQIGKLVVCSIRQTTAGTSNATTKSISAPVVAATITNMIWAETCAATDNGTDLPTSSQVSIASGSSTINFAKDLSTLTGGWTASGGHKIKYCTLLYEAA